MFSKFQFLLLKKIKTSFLVVIFKCLDLLLCFYSFSLLLSRFWTVFGRFGQIQKSKLADQDGRHSKLITLLLSHVTSYPHDADVRGEIFRHTIYPSSLVVIAFIFSELRRGGGIRLPPPPTPVVEDQKKPGLNRVKNQIWNQLKSNAVKPVSSGYPIKRALSRYLSIIL